MKAPDKIYLSVEKGEDWAYAMWTQKNPEEQKFSELDEHEEYIRKDALIGWLEYTKTLWNQTGASLAAMQAIQMVIDKLNKL